MSSQCSVHVFDYIDIIKWFITLPSGKQEELPAELLAPEEIRKNLQ